MSEIRSQATPAVSVRDRMTRIARTLLVTRQYHSPSMAMLGLIDALADDGWSKPRTVNNTAEPKALPLGSVITWLDDNEREAAVIDWEPGEGRHTASAYWMGLESMISYPATVLFTPGDAG